MPKQGESNISRQLNSDPKSGQVCPVVKRYLYSLWKMGRPLFLMGTVPLYLLGVAAAWRDGYPIQAATFVSGLFLVWLIQLMTHYNNEYCDLETDLATEITTHISGGSRVLVRKIVPRTTARVAAVTCLFSAIALAAVMVAIMSTGALILGFVGVAAFLGWFYSAKPLRLEAAGLGEAAIVLVSCFLLPLAGYYLQTSNVSIGLLIVCVPLGLLTFALTLATEIPDSSADKATGKKTLVVRLGSIQAMQLLSAALAVGWVAYVVIIAHMQPFWGWISAAISIPMLVMIGLNIRFTSKPDIAKVERLGLLMAFLLGYAGICLLMAFLI